MIMLTALVRQLHERYGAPCFVVGTSQGHHPVFRGLPDVAHHWVLPRHRPFLFSSSWLPIVAALRRTAPSPIYVVEWSPPTIRRIHRLLAWSGIDRRRIVDTGADPTGEPGLHWSGWMRRIGELTPPVLSVRDYPPPAGDWPPRLQLSPQDRAECAAWLADRGWTGRPLILVQPGNHRSASSKRGRWRRLNKDDKAWPIERWGELLRLVHARMPQAQILMRGAPTEVPMLEEVRAASGLGPDAVATAYVPLQLTFALSSVAHSMISVDTGPGHAAAALGLPLVVLFGVQPPVFWAPRSCNGSPVLTVGGPPVTTRADQVPVEAVFDAWCQLLEMPPLAPEPGPVEPATALADA